MTTALRILCSVTFIIGVTLCIEIIIVKQVQAANCYESSIQSPTPFMGNNGEVFKLIDGSLWEVKFEYEYMYEYYPSVVMCPDRSKMLVNGKSLNVVQISGPTKKTTTKPKTDEKPKKTQNIIESRIDGEFTGWEGETIFKLVNGQIWQQASYAYHYSYKYSPRVMIFAIGDSYEMQVEGIDSRIQVVRIK